MTILLIHIIIPKYQFKLANKNISYRIKNINFSENPSHLIVSY